MCQILKEYCFIAEVFEDKVRKEKKKPLVRVKIN